MKKIVFILLILFVPLSVNSGPIGPEFTLNTNVSYQYTADNTDFVSGSNELVLGGDYISSDLLGDQHYRAEFELNRIGSDNFDVEYELSMSTIRWFPLGADRFKVGWFGKIGIESDGDLNLDFRSDNSSGMAVSIHNLVIRLGMNYTFDDYFVFEGRDSYWYSSISAYIGNISVDSTVKYAVRDPEFDQSNVESFFSWRIPINRDFRLTAGIRYNGYFNTARVRNRNHILKGLFTFEYTVFSSSNKPSSISPRESN